MTIQNHRVTKVPMSGINVVNQNQVKRRVRGNTQNRIAIALIPLVVLEKRRKSPEGKQKELQAVIDVVMPHFDSFFFIMHKILKKRLLLIPKMNG